MRKRNCKKKKRKHFSCSGNGLIFFLGWISLDGNRWKIDFLLISLSFFPSSANGLFVKGHFYPLPSSCFSVLLFERLFSFVKEGPNSSLSLSLPADYNLKPPFPVLHLQGFVQSTAVIKKHWWARLSMIYNVLGNAEILAKIAFIIFWPMIVP